MAISAAERGAANPQEVHHYRSDIQGLRAIAVTLVLLFHSGLPLPGGYLGVDVFFVVSGFVITGVLRRELDSTGRIEFRAFYVRRFRRLGPALALMISVALLLSFFLQSPLGPQQATSKMALGAVMFSANAVAYQQGSYFSDLADTNPFLHTWSLSVEEQFYFVFPALVFLFAVKLARGRGERTAFWAISVGTAASLGLCALLGSGRLSVGNPASIAFYSSPTRAWEFGVGAAAAFWPWRVHVWRANRVFLTLLATAGLCLITWSAVVVEGSRSVPGLSAVPAVIGTVIVILACRQVNPIKRLLSAAPLVWLGDRSYGVYLWHWPLVVYSELLWPGNRVAPLAATLLALPIAALSYRTVELPIQQGNGIGKRALIWVTLASFTLPLIIGSVVWLGADRGWGDSELRRLATRQGAWENPPPECRLLGDTRYECDYRFSSEGPVIFFVGDSHAMALSEAVAVAAKEAGGELRIRALAGCPFALIPKADEQPDEECADWTTEIVHEIQGAHPDLLMIHQCPRVGAPCELIEGNEQWLDAYAEGLERVVKSTLDVGAERVVLLEDVPFFPNDISTCVTVFGMRGRCGVRMLEEVSRHHLDLQAIFRDERWNSESVAFVNPIQELCDDDSCTQLKNGEPLYRDSNHLSTSGAQLLGPLLRQIINTQT